MIVWAGNHDLTVAFADSPADNLLTGSLHLSSFALRTIMAGVSSRVLFYQVSQR